jgi:hypothetical protein
MSVVAIRWLGAHERRLKAWDLGEVIKTIEFELSQADREVAFAYQSTNRGAGKAKIGLIVDTRRSTISAVYAGDAWTEVDDGGYLYNTRSYRLDTHWNRARLSDVGQYGYDEATGRLSFCGVVVAPYATKEIRKVALKAAKIFGLPYLGSLDPERHRAYSLGDKGHPPHKRRVKDERSWCWHNQWPV